MLPEIDAITTLSKRLNMAGRAAPIPSRKSPVPQQETKCVLWELPGCKKCNTRDTGFGPCSGLAAQQATFHPVHFSFVQLQLQWNRHGAKA